MDKTLKHIVEYVESKGIKIVYESSSSEFRHDTPDTIFIDRCTLHGLSVSILHEYFHSRQWKRRKPRYNRAIIEYQAEAFAIRCCKKLDITYDKAFVEQNWRDRPNYLVKSYYYVTAYELLIENKVL